MSWVAWWAVLALWKLGPAVPALRRVSQEDAHGSASVNFSDGGFSATITEGAKVAWEGRISILSLTLLVGVPPLILWAMWLRRQKRPDPPAQIAEGMSQAAQSLRTERENERGR